MAKKKEKKIPSMMIVSLLASSSTTLDNIFSVGFAYNMTMCLCGRHNGYLYFVFWWISYES